MLLAACSRDRAASSVSQADPVTRVYHVAGQDSLHLHVFEPAAPRRDSARSAVLLFHGGGWTAGSPEWTFESARTFADQGFVAVAVEYRLSGGEWTPIDALADVCESFRWIRRNADEFGIDSTRIAGHGVSAGGHLLASTVTVGCPGADDHTRSTPDLLLLWSPALDVTSDGWFASQLKGSAEPELFSPALHVGSSTPPTSIVHGDSDTLTPLVGASTYCAALEGLGTRCELNVYPGVGHLLTRNLANQESDFDPDPNARADGRAKHLRFLRANGF
jgi:acetyl esterase/lipase